MPGPLAPLVPLLLVAATAALVLLLDLLPPRERKGHLAVVSLLGVVAALLAALLLWGQGGRAFGGMLLLDNFALFLAVVIC